MENKYVVGLIDLYDVCTTNGYASYEEANKEFKEWRNHICNNCSIARRNTIVQRNAISEVVSAREVFFGDDNTRKVLFLSKIK